MASITDRRKFTFRHFSKTCGNGNALTQGLGAAQYVWNHFLEKSWELLKTGCSGFWQKLQCRATGLIAAHPKMTSRMCHQCRHFDKDNRKTQSKFRCLFCGHSANADVNASSNIFALGTRAIGQERSSGFSSVELSGRYGVAETVNHSL